WRINRQTQPPEPDPAPARRVARWASAVGSRPHRSRSRTAAHGRSSPVLPCSVRGHWSPAAATTRTSRRPSGLPRLPLRPL
ncbi:MAG: hypothetical protein AVDCRST_MAG53-3412, partial [uncultured Solirubrobacteraceae bacterium]